MQKMKARDACRKIRSMIHPMASLLDVTPSQTVGEGFVERPGEATAREFLAPTPNRSLARSTTAKLEAAAKTLADWFRELAFSPLSSAGYLATARYVGEQLRSAACRKVQRLADRNCHQRRPRRCSSPACNWDLGQSSAPPARSPRTASRKVSTSPRFFHCRSALRSAVESQPA